MLDLMRRKKRLKWILWLVIAALALSMLVFFVPGGPGEGWFETSNTVASVDGRDISFQDFSAKYRRMVDGVRASNNIDAETLRSIGFPRQALEDLITIEILNILADRFGIRVTDEEIRKTVESFPAFQENGRFVGVDIYKDVLAHNNFTAAEFEDDIRRLRVKEKVQAFLTSPLNVSEQELRDSFLRSTQIMQVDYVLLKSDDFNKRVKPTQAELETYFNANSESYRIREKRRAEYIAIPVMQFISEVQVTEQDILNEWNAQPHDEVVEAAHILIRVEDPSKDAEARKKAETALKLAKSGRDFAGLAKQFSEDPGSAAQGGYLGPFQRGMMVPEFEEAAFAMKAGEISNLVRTDYGYHIIKVLRRERPTLDAYRDQLSRSIKERKMVELAKQKAEEAAAAALKQKDLKEAAKSLKFIVEVKETAFFQKEDNPYDFGIEPAFRDEVFELKEVGAIGKVVEYPLGFAVPKLAEVQLPRPGTLAEFRAQVEKDYIDFRAKELMQAEALKLSEEGAKQSNLATVAKAMGWNIKKSQEFTLTGTPDPEIGANTPFNKAAFDLEPGAVSAPQPILENVAVFQVKTRSPFDETAFDAQKDMLRKQMLESLRNNYFQEYVRIFREELEKAKKVKVHERILERAAM